MAKQQIKKQTKYRSTPRHIITETVEDKDKISKAARKRKWITTYSRDKQTYCVKEHKYKINILGKMVCVTTTQLCHCRTKAFTFTGHCCGPRKLYSWISYSFHVWPKAHFLLCVKKFSTQTT